MYMNDEYRLKVGLAEMLKGGVIMDVVNAEQAQIAERALSLIHISPGRSGARAYSQPQRAHPITAARVGKPSIQKANWRYLRNT